ncbi:DUF2004 domain-containing protein [Allorhizocola rhizosphaerae]|uniref:DUF2004 domain-containing protein n=1 Tax=Allorhizocola rhizosphaerae TaxID=1872709 RepID=UPI0013C359DA|nr:DUF2004 domain-containing protein [Allorhizocola rhizosphaerae]
MEVDNIVEGAELFVSDVARFDGLAREAMRRNWDEDEYGARLYAEHHELSDLDTLLARLQLVRVGFEADEPDRFAVFDYTIGAELTQYLVVVSFDREVTDVSMES